MLFRSRIVSRADYQMAVPEVGINGEKAVLRGALERQFGRKCVADLHDCVLDIPFALSLKLSADLLFIGKGYPSDCSCLVNLYLALRSLDRHDHVVVAGPYIAEFGSQPESRQTSTPAAASSIRVRRKRSLEFARFVGLCCRPSLRQRRHPSAAQWLLPRESQGLDAEPARAGSCKVRGKFVMRFTLYQDAGASIHSVATILAASDERRHIAPLTERDGSFGLIDAYRVTAEVRRLREACGERVVGRKIGFTNTTIWAEYNVTAPIWGYVYDTTLHRVSSTSEPVALAPFVEPRIEPEIVFGLAQAPQTGMDERALLACVAWVALGFEIVQSLFPGWRFRAPDTVAAFGLHGALFCR